MLFTTYSYRQKIPAFPRYKPVTSLKEETP